MGHPIQRRVVITGLGIVASNGVGKEAFWQATHSGCSGIRRIERFDTIGLSVQVAGEVQGFLPAEHMDRKLVNRTDRMTHFALAATCEALQDARLDLSQEHPQRVGAVIANTVGGVEYVLEQMHALYTRGPRAMSAYTAIAWLQVANVGQVSLRYGIQGYCKTPVNDTVGGLDALGLAYRAIQRGSADVLIAGGCEALLQPCVLTVLAQGNICMSGNDPDSYRPFDRRAAGLILAEGSGICILEEYEHALHRGVPIYGELVGYGQSNEAHGWHPHSGSGKQYARAFRQALQESCTVPEEISYISLDGRAHPVADRAEAEALQLTFGAASNEIPVSVPRTMQGHSYAATGAIDTITALLALQHRCIPPTINCGEPDLSYDLHLVRNEGLERTQPVALIAGRGLTGANSVLAVRRL